jgi:hypothetical protein
MPVDTNLVWTDVWGLAYQVIMHQSTAALALKDYVALIS